MKTVLAVIFFLISSSTLYGQDSQVLFLKSPLASQMDFITSEKLNESDLASYVARFWGKANLLGIHQTIPGQALVFILVRYQSGNYAIEAKRFFQLSNGLWARADTSVHGEEIERLVLTKTK